MSTAGLLGDSELKLDGSVGWRHVIAASNTMTSNYGGPSFTTTSAALPVDTLDIGLGGTLALTDSASLGLNYTGSFATNAVSQAVAGSLKVNF